MDNFKLRPASTLAYTWSADSCHGRFKANTDAFPKSKPYAPLLVCIWGVLPAFTSELHTRASSCNRVCSQYGVLAMIQTDLSL
jgi:hypothetical protein